MKKIPVLFAFLCIITTLPAQTLPDSCHLRISLVTCAAGADLYSIFGHTGIRVVDSARNADIVFNYGTFDDSDPYFYLKFTRGIMVYSLSEWPYPTFMEEYQAERRAVTEQVLQLNCAEKQRLVNALVKNAEEANRYYNYRFHTDNCTTRARDMIAHALDTPIHFSNILPGEPPSFRDLIHNCLDRGGQSWNKLAIDLLLGAHLDATVTNEQAMFLPDYLARGMDSAQSGAHPLVDQTVPLLSFPPLPPANPLLTPMVLFSAWLVLMVALSLIRAPWTQKALRVLDVLLFLLTGLLGIVFWAVWLGRVDNVCSNNWNVVWALPTHAVVAFMLNTRKRWLKWYWLITTVTLALLLFGWSWWPQQMNNALIPLVALLLFRSLQHFKKQ